MRFNVSNVIELLSVSCIISFLMHPLLFLVLEEGKIKRTRIKREKKKD
jgi:hypothetical protein